MAMRVYTLQISRLVLKKAISLIHTQATRLGVNVDVVDKGDDRTRELTVTVSGSQARVEGFKTVLEALVQSFNEDEMSISFPLEVGIMIASVVKSRLRMAAAQQGIKLEIIDDGGLITKRLTLNVTGTPPKLASFYEDVQALVDAVNGQG